MKKSYVILFVLAFSLVAPAYGNDAISEGSYSFKTFEVPGIASGNVLQVNHISDTGTIVGFYTPAANSNERISFFRKPDGTLVTFSDPRSNNLTEAEGVNAEGTIVGLYFDVANGQNSGFFYNGGKFVTYNIPGLLPQSTTAIIGINELGAFCGYYQAAPAFVTVPYCNWFGIIDTNFPIPGSTFTEPIALNNLGEVAGAWVDSASTDHGFLRSFDGKLTYIDVPGAGSMGTVVNGVNDFGWLSGHYWDTKNFEHGFVRSPDGKFYQIDEPGAFTNASGKGTGGGGLNDEGVVAGHYDPSNGGVQRGYIATPAGGDPD